MDKRHEGRALSPSVEPETSDLLSDLQSDRRLPGNYEASDPRKSAALRMLTAAAHGVSLSDVAKDIRSTLGLSHRGRLDSLRAEIVKAIWDPSWKPSEPLSKVPSGEPSAEVYFQNLVERSGASHLNFYGSRAREAAVADSISQTYSWIYDRHPKPESSGGFLWSSFPEWLERPSDSTYWITGKPGSGKSTIIKHILTSPALRAHLSKWAGQVPLFIVSYYAWNAGATLQKSFQGLKMTLLSQLLHQQPQFLPLLFPRRVAYLNLVEPDTQLWAHDDNEIDEAFDSLLTLSRDRNKICLAIFIDGLDEFISAPKDVVALIDSITASSGNGVKLCVASRPWVEFDDAYRDVPKLQMDGHTRADMTTFVTEKFRSCQAFTDLKTAYPVETTQLLHDVTVKANGIFVWLRVVVEALVESATEGVGMRGLENILRSLPSDMSLLYDTIWARIPERSQKRGAVLLWLMEISPLSMGSMLRSVPAWLADEYAFQTIDIEREHLGRIGSGQPFHYIRAALKRKLASRTRGLLELVCLDPSSATTDTLDGLDQWMVSYTHRTVKDWANQETIRNKIILHCGDSFDPFLFLLELYTIQITSAELCPTFVGRIWSQIIDPALSCAQKVSCHSTERARRLLTTLRTFDKTTGQLFDSEGVLAYRVPAVAPAVQPRAGAPQLPRLRHWSALYLENSYSERRNFEAADDGRAKSFITLAAQFGILHYIQAEFIENPSVLDQPGTRESLGILECAIFGRILYRASPANVYHYFDIGRDRETRLEMVRFLLDNGVRQADLFISESATPGLRNSTAVTNIPLIGKMISIQELISCTLQEIKGSESRYKRVYVEYFTQVAELLNQTMKRRSGIVYTVLRSTSKWLKARGTQKSQHRGPS